MIFVSKYKVFPACTIRRIDERDENLKWRKYWIWETLVYSYWKYRCISDEKECKKWLNVKCFLLASLAVWNFFQRRLHSHTGQYECQSLVSAWFFSIRLYALSIRYWGLALRVSVVIFISMHFSFSTSSKYTIIFIPEMSYILFE